MWSNTTTDDRVIEVFPALWILFESCINYDTLIYTFITVNIKALIHIPTALPLCTNDTWFIHPMTSWSWTWLLHSHHTPLKVLRLSSHWILWCGLSIAEIFWLNPINDFLVLAWFWVRFFLFQNRVNIKFHHFISRLSEIAPSTNQIVGFMKGLSELCYFIDRVVICSRWCSSLFSLIRVIVEPCLWATEAGTFSGFPCNTLKIRCLRRIRSLMIK